MLLILFNLDMIWQDKFEYVNTYSSFMISRTVSLLEIKQIISDSPMEICFNYRT